VVSETVSESELLHQKLMIHSRCFEEDVDNRKTVGLVRVVGTKMDITLPGYRDKSTLPFLRTLPKVVPNNDRASRVTC